MHFSDRAGGVEVVGGGNKDLVVGGIIMGGSQRGEGTWIQQRGVGSQAA